MKPDNEKQAIEEMAAFLWKNTIIHTEDLCHDVAETVIKEGYRKQRVGEWVQSDIPQEKYVCSACGGACWYYDFEGDVAKSRYCPNCGARMKGGAE